MSKLGAAWFRGYVRSCLITLLSFAIVVPLSCVCIFIPLGVATNSDVDSTTGLLVLVVSASLFFLIVVGGAWGAFAGMLWRRARWLNAVFGPLGLTGKIYMLTGRQYHGTVEGRQIDAYFYRGPTLDLRVSTSLQTRFTVVQEQDVSRTLARAFNYQPLTLTDPGLQGLSVSVLDEDWARRLFANPEVQAILQRLLAGEGWALFRQMHLQPGTLFLRLYRNRNLFRYEITPAQARQWLDDLLTLARIAESLPAPQKTAELTSLERMARSSRKTSTFLVLIISLIVLFVVLPLCVILPILLFAT